ncbi:AAA family ATPase [Streptomyces sp. NBC_01775]|uniref:AAA family ATPase n=1 Tax=Streptomyces sp. NBC_01775 TaxID=2975939 RepID=UPI002DD92178|nr:AAA family ATPase [Streptomyces sp. NBC_01775]WSB78306.1 AAA family ATPase [Streptomyces sp. NBC_01775]
MTTVAEIAQQIVTKNGVTDADTPNPEESPARRLVLVPASKIRIRPVRWLWDTTPPDAPPTSHGRIPLNSLSLAAGGPGLGKSQFGIWLSAKITTGQLPGQLYGKPHSVIYAASEDSWSYTIAPRLLAAGADMERVFRVDVKDDEKMHARLSLPVDISLLGKAAEMYSVALVVADPLLSLLDSGINDYRATEVRSALEPLVAAADRHGFTVLGLAHFTKAGTADPLSRVSGSGAFGQLIRALIAFAKRENDDGDEEFVMSLEKNNLGRVGLPGHLYAIQPVTVETEEGPAHISRFALGPETSASVRDVMRDEGTVSAVDRAERTEAADWLEDYLTSADTAGEAEPRDVQNAANKAGITPNALRDAKKKLGVKSYKPKGVTNAAWVWRLPGYAPDVPVGDTPEVA